MKQSLISILSAICIICSFGAMAEVKYYDARNYPLFGKGIEDSASKWDYSRLPDSITPILERPALMEMAECSAGMFIRFRSESPSISTKWKSTHQCLMNHQTPTGTRGLDLYVLEDDGKTWTFVNSARPNPWNANTEVTIIGNMDPKMREYMLYLSLYDGVDSLYIGADPKYTIEQPVVDLPKREKPIIMYGTSLLQGGCANRPGMAHSNILSRWLNRQVINLGFSGLGQLDLPVAKTIAAIPDPGMIVLEMVPNANVEQMDTLLVRFYDIIREAHPNVPILFVEDPQFPHTRFDKAIAKEVARKNECIKKHFNNFKKRGEKNIYYLKNDDLYGHDHEATVDALHLTDLGFVRISKVMYPILKKRALK